MRGGYAWRGERVKGGLDIIGIPTSKSTESLAMEHGITLGTLDQHPSIDLTIDGADEIDPHLNIIKGMGGALLREKVVASVSEKVINQIKKAQYIKEVKCIKL